MALNYSIFSPSRSGSAGMATGVNASNAGNGDLGIHGVLAASTDSGAIVGPCLLVLTADEGQRVVIRKGSAVGADPGATAMKLVANAPMSFDLGSGNWFVRQVAG